MNSREYYGMDVNDALAEFRRVTDTAFHKVHFWENAARIERKMKRKILELFGEDSDIFEWCTCVIAGSRARGIEYDTSDLNLLFFYRGNADEKDIAEYLEERPLYHDSFDVTVCPVRVSGRGLRILRVLSNEEKYLSIRASAGMIEQKLTEYLIQVYKESGEMLSHPRNEVAGMIVRELQDGKSDILSRFQFSPKDSMYEYLTLNESE